MSGLQELGGRQDLKGQESLLICKTETYECVELVTEV